ncbi:MAG TPA: pyruvate kinase, partial [Planctomycetota bacterium]
CTVRRGAEVSSNQGVNLPDSHLSAPLLAARDRRDIEFAVKHGVDWLAVSFVRGPEDLREVRKAVKKAGGDLLLIAKIELPVAVKRLDEILDEADAVMVARGDLAVEMGHEVVPTIQKRIIQRAIETARPVITATEMLESMIANAQPTRAEVSDVANAVIDGTDAVMLSGETAVGAFPVETVRTMHRIVARTETELFGTHARPRRRRTADFRCDTPERAIVLAAVTAADIGQARVVVAFTESGRTARLVSSFRSAMPVMGLTSREASFHRMALYWGVRPVLMRSVDSVSSMYREGVRVLSKAKWLKTGDLVAALTGTFAVSGATNTLRLMPFAELGLVADSKPRRNK